MKKILLIVAGVLFFLFQTGLAGDHFGKVEKSILKMTEFPDDPDAEAVLLVDEGEMKIKSDFTLSSKVHRRIKILTEEGKEYGKIEIFYYHEDRIHNLKAICILPNGKKIKFNKKKDVKEEKFGRTKKLTVLLPGVEVGSVVEYKYEVISDYIADMDPWYFQHNIYTVKSSITVRIMEGFAYNTFFMNIEGIDPDPVTEQYTDAESRKKYSSYTWELLDLPAIPKEPYMTTVNDYRTSLHFQIMSYEDPWTKKDFIKGWKSLSKKVLDNYNPFINNTKFVNKLTHQLAITDSLQPSEKLKLYYDYIRSKIGNTNGSWYVPLDLNGSTVLEKSETYPTVKNLMLIAIARKLGLKADPVLISTRSHGKISKDLPKLDQFNRAIARVQDGFRSYFLDAGSASVPFKVLPQSDLIPEGYWLKKDQSKFVTLRSKAVKNYIGEKTHVKMMSEDSLHIETTLTYSGYDAYAEKSKMRKKNTAELWNDRLKETFPEYKLDTLFIQSDDENSVIVKYEITVPNNIQSAGDKMYVEFPAYNKFVKNPFKRENRNFPVDYSYFGSDELEVHFEIPQGMKVVDIPEAIRVHINGAYLTCSIDNDKNEVVLRRNLGIQKLRFKTREYKLLRNLYQKAVEGDKMTVVLSEGAL